MCGLGNTLGDVLEYFVPQLQTVIPVRDEEGFSDTAVPYFTTCRAMPVNAAQVKGSLTILKPEFRKFSPALGLLLVSSPSFVNNLYNCNVQSSIWGMNSSCMFARETYFTRDAQAEEPRPCRNPSKPIAHLSPKTLGHVLGLAISDASDNDIQTSLRASGIETNRVNGVWTGVSLARYKRLVWLVRDAYKASKVTPAIPLLTRLAWEKSETKGDILKFYQALSSHVGQIFNDSVKELNEETSSSTDQFLDQQFVAAELQNEEGLSSASKLLAQSTREATTDFAESLELMCASLSQAQVFKPAWKINRHFYKGGKQVPDCVEVSVRELTDLLVYDAQKTSFDTSRLPKTTRPSLRQFYASHDDFESEASRSLAWFNLCQEIEGCEYISDTDGGRVKYELFPSFQNILTCLGDLLGRPEWSTDSKAFVGHYNQHCESIGMKDRLFISETRQMFRAALSEESRRREIVTVGFNHSPHFLEVTLEGAHRLATVKHCRKSEGRWIRETRPLHLSQVLSGRNQSSLLTSAFWPVFLQDYLLAEIPNKAILDDLTVVESVLSARWGSDRQRWSLERPTLTAEVTPSEQNAAHRASSRLAMKGLEMITKDPSASPLKQFIPWIASRCPANISPKELLQVVSLKEALWRDEKTMKGFQQSENPACARMLQGDLRDLSMLGRLQFWLKGY